MKIGTVLRHYRVFNELALRDVSKEIGIGAATLMRLEHGLSPDGQTLAKILTWLMKSERTNGTSKGVRG